MKKQSAAFLIAIAFLACAVSAAFAKLPAPKTVVGTWAVSGSTWIKADVKVLGAEEISLTIQVPKVAMFSEQFTFGAATSGTGSFTDTLLGMSGSNAGNYTVYDSGAFTINLDEWIASVQSHMLSLVQTIDPSATVTLSSVSLKGKLASANQITITADVEFEVGLPSVNKTVPVSFLGTLNGTRVSTAAAARQSLNTAESTGTFIFENLVMPIVGFSVR